MTQTGTYKKIEPEEEELEVSKEISNMIRPAVDFSTVHHSVTKTETLSWAEESYLELQKDEELPLAVLRPKEKSKTKVMRGITDGIGMGINSQPDKERILLQPDDATIKSSEASTAVLRRPSNYQPTELGSQSSTITEEIQPAKKIPLAPYDFEMEISPSVVSSTVYAPVRRPEYLEREDHFDELMEENPVNLHRTTGTFNGVYFPCMGMFVAPLFGTPIFPLPPKQERYHFKLMMNEPTDHFDGNPNSKYEDEIRRLMKPQILAFGKTSVAINNQWLLSRCVDLWYQKFPLAGIRWGEKSAAYDEQALGATHFETVEQNPNLLGNRHDYERRKIGHVRSRKTVTGLHNPPSPVTSKDQLLLKKQQLESQKLKLFIGEADLGQSETLTAYDKYTNVVLEFRKRGGTFKSPPNNIRKVSQLIHEVNCTEDMQYWLVNNQGKNDFNAFHAGWTDGPLLSKRLGQTDRTRLFTFMFTCLEYHNFIQIRQQVKL